MMAKPTRGAERAAEARAWQRMLSGRRLDLLDPSPEDIDIADIAHGLARLARWNGQTIGDHAFSVAQHALVVEQIAAALQPETEQRWLLAALLHDAPEYVIGDLISPFKAAVGLDYRAFEARLLQTIHRRFGLPPALPETTTAHIKRADGIAAYYEATVLAGFSRGEAVRFFGEPGGLPPTLQRALEALTAQSPARAQHAFLERFDALVGK